MHASNRRSGKAVSRVSSSCRRQALLAKQLGVYGPKHEGTAERMPLFSPVYQTRNLKGGGRHFLTSGDASEASGFMQSAIHWRFEFL